MDKLPFVGAFTEAYQGAQTIWQRFRSDVISLLILGMCLYLAGYHLRPEGLSLLSVQELKSQIAILDLLDTEVAKDIGTVTLIAVALAIAAIIVQGTMQMVGSSCQRLLHAMFPLQYSDTRRRIYPNFNALAYVAARLPEGDRKPYRIWDEYNSLEANHPAIQNAINDSEAFQYHSSKTHEAARVAQNAAGFLVFFWLPDRISQAVPDVLVGGSRGELMFLLLIFLLIAEWLYRRAFTFELQMRESLLDHPLQAIEAWQPAINAVQANRQMYADLAYKAWKEENKFSAPSLRRHLWCKVRGKLVDRRGFRFFLSGLKVAHQEVDEIARKFEFDRVDYRDGEMSAERRAHMNDNDPEWIQKYAAWRYMRLYWRIRGFCHMLLQIAKGA